MSAEQRASRRRGEGPEAGEVTGMSVPVPSRERAARSSSARTSLLAWARAAGERRA